MLNIVAVHFSLQAHEQRCRFMPRSCVFTVSSRHSRQLAADVRRKPAASSREISNLLNRSSFLITVSVLRSLTLPLKPLHFNIELSLHFCRHSKSTVGLHDIICVLRRSVKLTGTYQLEGTRVQSSVIHHHYIRNVV